MELGNYYQPMTASATGSLAGPTSVNAPPIRTTSHILGTNIQLPQLKAFSKGWGSFSTPSGMLETLLQLHQK